MSPMMLPTDRRILKALLWEIEHVAHDAALHLDIDSLTLDQRIEQLSDDLNIIVEDVQELNQRILLLRGNR